MGGIDGTVGERERELTALRLTEGVHGWLGLGLHCQVLDAVDVREGEWKALAFRIWASWVAGDRLGESIALLLHIQHLHPCM
jgi:hypothetical protein